MAKVTALAPVVARFFSFDLDLISWVIALFYILGFLLAFPAAAIINKLGLRKAISIAIACGALGSLFGVVTNNFIVFMISRVFEGAGMGIMGVAGASAIAPWFPKERRGFPLGIWAMWVALAMFICPVLYGWISESMGVFNPFEASMESLSATISVVWWGNFIFDVIVLAIFNLFYRDAPPDFIEKEEPVADVNMEKIRISDVFRNGLLWALGLIFLFHDLAFMAINGLFTTYLTGGSPTVPSPIALDMLDATVLASLAAIIGAIMAPVFGKISDALKTRKWVLLVALLGGVAYASLVFTSSEVSWYYWIVVIGGIAGGGVPAIIWAATPETVKPELIPSANAFVAFTQNLGMFIGAIALGSITLSFGWVKASFTLLVPCYIICILILFIGLRKLR